jgi:hypothetical protein
MASVALVPARLRDGKLIPVRGTPPNTLTWVELRNRLAPTRSKQALMLLRALRPGCFVGTRRLGPKQVTFTLDAVGRSNALPRAIQTDPEFERSLVEVFYVDAVDWESGIVEARTA